jgi:hypothetical protein
VGHLPIYAGHYFNPLTPELNSSAQRCLPRFFNGGIILKGFTERRFYESFGVKGLMGCVMKPQVLTAQLLQTDAVWNMAPWLKDVSEKLSASIFHSFACCSETSVNIFPSPRRRTTEELKFRVTLHWKCLFVC